MSRVTKKMFIEAYARWYIERHPFYRDIERLGKMLARVSTVISKKADPLRDVAYEDWVRNSNTVQDVCATLDIEKPTLAKLRALPKE